MANKTETITYLIQFVHDKAKAEQVYSGLQKLNEGHQKLDINIGKLATRAMTIIPVWLALRNAYMGFFKTIQDGIKYIVEFDKAMAKMSLVTTNVGNKSSFMQGLGEDTRKYTREYGVSLQEVSEVYKKIAETGVSGKTAQAAMNSVLKTSIGLMEDSGDVAKMYIYLHRLLGNTIKGATTEQEKFNYIGGMFATLWEKNAGSLHEYIGALENFIGVATTRGLKLDETMFLATYLHNLGQVGGTAGTQLKRAFQEIVKNEDQIEKFLGRPIKEGESYFDYLIEIMGKLNQVSKQNPQSLPKFIQEIFGMKSETGISSLVADFDKFIAQWKELGDMPVAEKISKMEEKFKTQMNTIESSFKKLKETVGEGAGIFMAGLFGMKLDERQPLIDFLNQVHTLLKDKINPALQTMADIVRAIGIALLASGIAKLLAGGLAGGAGVFGKALKDANAARTAVAANALSKSPKFLSAQTYELAGKSNLAVIGIALASLIPGFLKKLEPGLLKLPWITIGAMIGYSAIEIIANNWDRQIKFGNKDRLDRLTPLARSAAKAGLTFAEFQGINKETSKLSGRDLAILADLYLKEKPGNIYSGAKTSSGRPIGYRGMVAAYLQKGQLPPPTEEALVGGTKTLSPEEQENILQKQILATERLAALGYNALEIEQIKLGLLDSTKEKREQELKIIQQINSEMIAYSDTLRGSFVDSFKGLFAGTIDSPGEFFKGISNTYAESQRTAVSEALTDQIFKTTGIGELFGSQMGSLRHMFDKGVGGQIKQAADYHGKTVYNAIVSASNVAAGRPGMGGGFYGISGNPIFGAGGGMGGGFTLPGFGQGGFMSTPMGYQYAGTTPAGQSVYRNSKTGAMTTNPGAINYGQLLGIATSGAMTGMAGAQGGNLGAGIMGGLGSLSLGASAVGSSMAAAGSTGWLASAAPALGVAGIVLSIGSLIWSLFQKPPKKWEQREVTEKTTQITSRIDVTNRQLEWVNRNLQAMRQELTFMMPKSAYFTERAETDRFAISSGRGIL